MSADDSKLSKSLDELIKESKSKGGDRPNRRFQRGRGRPNRGGNRGNGRGPRRFRDNNRDRDDHLERRDSRRDNRDRDHHRSNSPRNDRRSDDRAPRDREEGKRRLRVSNLGKGITHDDLNELFSKFGKLTKNKIIFDNLGRSEGVAIIEYEKPESAEKAINEYNGATLDEKILSVTFDSRRQVHGVQKRFITKDFRRGGFRGGRRN